MNKLRAQYCDEINTPLGLDNVYDYVKWLETKLNKQIEVLQLRNITSVYECKVCGKPYGDKLSLYEHYDSKHNKE
jgi:hypothetical protein